MHKFLYYLNLKQFLATAATLAIVVPAVKAETWWLMAAGEGGYNNDIAFDWSIPTNSLDECEAAGQKFIEHPWKQMRNRKDYIFVKAK